MRDYEKISNVLKDLNIVHTYYVKSEYYEGSCYVEYLYVTLEDYEKYNLKKILGDYYEEDLLCNKVIMFVS